MADLPDQVILWNKKHAAGEHAEHRAAAMPLVHEAVNYIAPGGKILEIGCGVGADAAFMAQRGFEVTATDLSSVVIEQNKAFYPTIASIFSVLDVTKPLPFDDNMFDAVYSHLALHYYDDATTRRVFSALRRVLKPGGILAFSCKSTHDSRYGHGQEVGPHMFLGKGGHVRHFFSIAYVKELLGNDYAIQVLQELEETYSDGVSSFIQCIAEKK